MVDRSSRASRDERRLFHVEVPADDPFELVGDGPAMQTLRTPIDAVARSSAPVLVIGETGVGKELVARNIHAQSPRHAGPFVAVNVAAIPTELLEGEIFGHARGAFTGAIQARRGLLTEAEGGTIVLDEIGDISVPFQAKLLRVIQFGDVRPVGSDRTHHVDARIVASTHRDLPALIADGKFREDLYYRLNVLTVRVPPLRERRDDIPALAEHLLRLARSRTPASPVQTIGADAMRSLASREWPGNVRELASCIERAVVFGVDEKLDVVGSVPCAAGRSTSFVLEAPLSLRRMIHEYVGWVLQRTRGNKQRAAELLEVDMSTLYRWRKRWSEGDMARRKLRTESKRPNTCAG